MDEGTTTYCYTGERPTLLFENVPALICGQCGERVFSSAITRQIGRIVREQPAPARIAAIPAYDFASRRPMPLSETRAT